MCACVCAVMRGVQTGSWRIALASHWGVATRGREGGSDIGCACVPHHCFKGGEVRDQVSGECDEGSLVPHLVTACRHR